MIPNSSSSQFNYLFGHLKTDVLICVQGMFIFEPKSEGRAEEHGNAARCGQGKGWESFRRSWELRTLFAADRGRFYGGGEPRTGSSATKLDDLEKQYTYICSERDSFKVGIGLCL